MHSRQTFAAAELPPPIEASSSEATKSSPTEEQPARVLDVKDLSTDPPHFRKRRRQPTTSLRNHKIQRVAKQITNVRCLNYYNHMIKQSAVFSGGMSIFHDITPTCKEPWTQAMSLISSNFSGPDEYGTDDLRLGVEEQLFRVLVIYQEGWQGVAGVVTLTRYHLNFAYNLEFFALHQKCQGKGSGTLVLGHLLRMLRREAKEKKEEGHPRQVVLTLECEKELIQFYKRSGAIEFPIEPHLWRKKKQMEFISIPYHFLFYSLSSSSSDSSLPLERLRVMGDCLYRSLYLNSESQIK